MLPVRTDETPFEGYNIVPSQPTGTGPPSPVPSSSTTTTLPLPHHPQRTSSANRSSSVASSISSVPTSSVHPRPRRLSRTTNKTSAIDPSRLLYESAVETMVLRRNGGVRKELPKAAVGGHRPTRRLYALGLCDWDLTEKEFEEQIQLWVLFRLTLKLPHHDIGSNIT